MVPTVFCSDAELELQLLAELGVEGTHRLVEQQHGRLEHQRPGQRDALLLATGELVRLALGHRAHLHELERGADAAAYVVLGGLLVAQPERDVLADVEEREQRVGLEHGVDRPLVRRHLREVAAVEQDLPGVGLLEARDHPQCRGLPASRRPEQREELALSDLEVEAVDRDLVTEPLHQPGEGEGAGHQAGSPSSVSARWEKLATNPSTSASVCCDRGQPLLDLAPRRQERAAVVLDQPVGVTVAAVERAEVAEVADPVGHEGHAALGAGGHDDPRRVVAVDDALEPVAHPVAQAVEVGVGVVGRAPR